MPKFKLKSVVEDIAGVPEAYRDRYTERDGKHYLDEIEIDDGAEVKTALAAEREERRKAKEALARFEGLDPEKAREALEAAQKAEEAKLRDKGKFDELLKAKEAAHAQELAKLGETITSQTQQLRKFKLDDRLRAAALKAGVLPDDLEDVMTLTGTRFDLSDDDQIVMKDGPGVTPEKFYGEVFREQRPKFYAPSGAGGSGAAGAGGAGGVTPTGSVNISDQNALNSNLEKIANGEVVVK
jgi:hypothetical protein